MSIAARYFGIVWGQLRELVSLIGRGEAPAALRSHLREFAELLVRHIRFEERTFFPALEKALREGQHGRDREHPLY